MYLSALYSGKFEEDLQLVTESGFTEKGAAWHRHLGRFSKADIKRFADMADEGRLPLPERMPTVISLAQLIADCKTIANADQPMQQPDTGPSGGWRDRMIAAERAKHPEREKQYGESSEGYALRMLKVMKEFSAEFDAKRIITPR